MQLKQLKVLLEGQDTLSPIGGLAWSSNQLKLAVATSDRHIYLYDENGKRRDKFSTKPFNPANGKQSYVVRGLSFSPDSTKLAVAQSDSIVYVYKLGESWNEKKVICNKFPQTAAVTAILWPVNGFLIAGLEDGKVRSLDCKTNSSRNLYTTDSLCVSLTLNMKSTGFLSGHHDGSVIRYYLNGERGQSFVRVLQHPVPPFALVWCHEAFGVGGCDQRIVFYDETVKRTDNRVEDEREFTVAESNTNGQTVAFASYNRLRIFNWNRMSTSWKEYTVVDITGFYTSCCLKWRRDGARLAMASVTGAVLILESVLKRVLWQDKFELIYVAPSQLLVHSLHGSQEQIIIRSSLGLEIDDVRIMGKDNYLVARTEESLIISDLTRNLTSEVPWMVSGSHERFYFENPNVCLIFNVGELSLVEYGDSTILGSVRTEFVNPHVISVRLNERQKSSDNKKLAFLLDAETICVVDLVTENAVAQLTHDCKIDWLELSETSHKLLFRDKKLRLFLFDVFSGKRRTLLNNISFVQWVPQSDVVVAQSNTNLTIWYNIDVPEHITIVPIHGEVLEVRRTKGHSVVYYQDGSNEYNYQLDENLVEFGTAINDNDFDRAIHYLETMNDKPSEKGMWHNLALIALEEGNLHVVHRCYAALGNISRAFYLMEMIAEGDRYEQETGLSDITSPEIKVRLALLSSDMKRAQNAYLENGQIEEAIQMYKDLYMWDEAICLAEKRDKRNLAVELRKEYLAYLLETQQEERAGQILEEQEDTEAALKLYLKANKPAHAAQLALKYPHLLDDQALMMTVTEGLVKSELYEMAGDIAYHLKRSDAAVYLYSKAGAFGQAIELARSEMPEKVIELEEEWGDWLVANKRLDASISHYIEAGVAVKALESAIGAKQWHKAMQIAKVIDEPNELQRYASEISRHLAFVGNLDDAEDLLIRSQMYREAVELLNHHGQWERAYKIGSEHLKTEEIRDLFINLSTEFENQGKYRECERILLTINEPDLAIAMYKRHELYDAMIRLIDRYHQDLVESTHQHLARILESKSKFKNAELHYLAAGDWKSAVHMYCTAECWSDAYRVAKQKGGESAKEASSQVIYMWSKSMPIESAVRLLNKYQSMDTAIQHACEIGEFEYAMDLCRLTGKPMAEVHSKIALLLEEQGKFEEAEAEFIKGNKPREAILMYTHAGNWEAAMRVAETHLNEAINDILVAQANSAWESQNYDEYETLLLHAHRPDLIIEQYKKKMMLNDARRIAEEHYPIALNDIKRLQIEYNEQTKINHSQQHSTSNSNSAHNYLQKATEFAKKEKFRKAAECLMQINDSITDDTNMIERALLRAAEICNQFLEGNNAVDIARQLGPRLCQIRQNGPAAQLYLAADLPKEAVDVFIRAEQWSKARRLAREIDPEYVTYVEQQQKLRLRNEGNIDQLADIDIMSALDMLAEQGQWKRCLEGAKKINKNVLQKYVALYAVKLIRDGDCTMALDLYINYDAPVIEANFNIYKKISEDCLALPEDQAKKSNLWQKLRDFLFNLSQKLKDTKFGAMTETIEKYLLISHYYTIRSVCREVQSLQIVAVRISVALLRYTDIIPVDKGFLEAGLDLRSIKREAEAFIMLNHYLDVCEAIEDGSGNMVDHGDLTATDFPRSVPLPEEIHLKNTPDQHEEVREWVLAVSMDQQVDQILPTDDRGFFESNLGADGIPCILSGYPVRSRQPVTFESSKRQANRDIWSKFSVAMKLLQAPEVNEIIRFIETWNGPANFIMR